MSIEKQIKSKIKAELNPQIMEVVDESAMHQRGGSSHFRALIVSSVFEGLSSVERHKRVYQALGSVMDQIHAFSQQTFTPSEWNQNAKIQSSPPCQHSKKSKK